MVNPLTANITQLTWLNVCDASCPWLASTPNDLGMTVMECVHLWVLNMPTSQSANSNLSD